MLDTDTSPGSSEKTLRSRFLIFSDFPSSESKDEGSCEKRETEAKQGIGYIS